MNTTLKCVLWTLPISAVSAALFLYFGKAVLSLCIVLGYVATFFGLYMGER